MVQRLQEDAVDISLLKEQVHLPVSKLVAQNVFLKAAMTERLSSWDQHDTTKRGTPSDALVRLYEEWGRGGFGIILSGNTMVDPVNLEAPGNPIFHPSVITEKHTEQAKKMAKGAKAHGSLYIVQLSHGGRQVAEFLQPQPVSASDVKLDDRMGMSFGKPKPATKEDIKQITEDFVFAAEYAKKIGADGVQLHGAHGYLIAQFLSSSTNKRTDEYGGSIENRGRFLFEIIEAIKKRINDPKFSIGLKLNSVEFSEGGFQPEEAAAICNKLNELGLDWVELSGGSYESLAFEHKKESTKAREGFFFEFADIIRPQVGQMKVYVTGGIRTSKAMVEALKKGSADGLGFARPVTEDPDLPSLIISGKAHSSRKTLIPESDFGLGNMASGIQMRQIGSGTRPFNSTDEKEFGEFKKTVGEFFKAQQEHGAKGVINAGYPDLAGVAYN